MKLLLFASAAALSLSSPAFAQMDMNMPGMKMPAKPTAKPAVKPAVKPKPKPTARRTARPPATTLPRAKERPTQPVVHHPAAQAAAPVPANTAMPDMPGMAMPSETPAGLPPTSDEHDMSSMPGMDTGTASAPESRDPDAGHDMSGMTAMPGTESPDKMIGNTPAPAPPTDHAADAVFGAAQMAPSRKMLRHENGGMPAYSVMFNLAEYRVQKGGDAYRWDGEGWFGGDINRLVVKSEGEGAVRGGVESAEVQALYSRAIGPWFNLQAGVRHDFKPGPARTYAAVGFEGLAPYWFELEGALFLSDKGDVLGRIEGYYDQRITQNLILQPRAELNFAAQDIPANGIGAGFSDAELGLRLRYEIRREFAPYVGVSWERKFGTTADFARAVGDRVQSTSLVLGIRTWF